MASLIPEDKISEISNRADIVEIISESVRLKKTGRNYVGLCPFHSEKTPSFSVSPEKQMFYCFGCNVGGGVFKFLQEYQGVSFVEAVRMLARRYGITLPEKNLTPRQKAAYRLRDGILEANLEAASFYHHGLVNKKDAHATAYLNARGMTDETIEKFKLGFAPAYWDRLAKHFEMRQISSDTAKMAGLVIPRDNKSDHYDRFRARIMFPIIDLNKRVLGFGGRVMDDSQPKYLNTPETPVFNKRQLLYGLAHARQQCRELETVHIVEGYFDVLALHQHDIRNTVATLGTALTPEHVRLLKGFTRRIILVFDSDQAGIKAAMRSGEFLLNENVETRIMVLPTGHDPDTYVRGEGREAFMALADSARGIVGFMMDTAIARNGQSIEGRVRTISELAPVFARVTDPAARALYIQELAERVDVEEGAIRKRLAQKKAGSLPAASDGPPLNFDDAMPGAGYGGGEYPGESPPAKPVRSSRGGRFEEQIVAMMLQYPKMIDEIKRRHIINLFEDDRLKKIAEHILNSITGAYEEFDPRKDISTLMADPKLGELVARLTVKEYYWERGGCLMVLDQFDASKKRRDASLIQRIKAAEQQDDQALLNQLLKDKLKQAQQRK